MAKLRSAGYTVIDGCPVPAEAAPVILEVKRRSGQVLTSCYRGPDARALLHANGKRDQEELYWGWVHRLPGFRPANPPGFSTHELRNDGVFLPGRARGAVLAPTQVGQDWTNGAAVVQAYRAMGVNAALTYPRSALESQHVNIRDDRGLSRWLRRKLPLQAGDKGRYVLQATHWLAICHSPRTHQRYLPHHTKEFTAQTRAAVIAFQRDHGLGPDGVIGRMTWHQLETSAGYWAKRAQQPVVPKPPTQVISIVDVSEHNGDVLWAEVRRAGHTGAYVKATEGLKPPHNVDARFTAQRVDALVRSGLLYGCYHFARPQHRPGMTLDNAARAEAEHFFLTVNQAGGWRRGCLPPVLDLEWQSGLTSAEVVRWATLWLDHVQGRLHEHGFTHNVRPWLYTGGFWTTIGNPRTTLGTRLWRAQYGPRLQLVGGWTDWTLWQHTDKGSVPGIAGAADLSKFNGTMAQLQRLTLG